MVGLGEHGSGGGNGGESKDDGWQRGKMMIIWRRKDRVCVGKGLSRRWRLSAYNESRKREAVDGKTQVF